MKSMKPEPKTIIPSKVYFKNLLYTILDVEIREANQAGAVGVEDPIILIRKALRLIFSGVEVIDAVLCMARIEILAVIGLPDVYISVGA